MPDFQIETDLMARGCRLVCGVDEVGRGPLAGPVTAAAVILHAHDIPAGLEDSKKITARARDQLFEQIMQRAHVSIAHVNARTIDALNIRAASLKAMEMAVAGLALLPDHALIDGNALPAQLPCPATTLVKGDGRSSSIAAASIVAKVVRDRLMERAEGFYPQFGLAGHKGYPTLQHRKAVAHHGPSPLHRHSFAPVKAALKLHNM